MKIINTCNKDETEVVEPDPVEASKYITRDELAYFLSLYAQKEHKHSTFDIVGLLEALQGKASKTHAHSMSNITGLAAALSGKSNLAHTHSIDSINGLAALLGNKSEVGHKHQVADITDLKTFTSTKQGLVPPSGGIGNTFLSADGTWKTAGLTMFDVANSMDDILPDTAKRWPNYLELTGNINNVLPTTAKRWPSFKEVTGNISDVLPEPARRWPTFSELGGNIEDVLPADFNAPIEFGDIVGDVYDILPETAKRWPTYDELGGDIYNQLTDHAKRWPTWFEVTGNIENVLPDTATRWPYYNEILGDIEDYLPETALRWPRYDEILGSFIGMLPETAIRWPTLEELGITNVDGGTVVIPPGSDQVEQPVNPFGFSAHGGIDFILLTWSQPKYNGHAYTEIYRLTEDQDNPNQIIDVAYATEVHEASGFIYSDSVPLRSNHYYWIRYVNSDGAKGQWSQALYAQTAQTYDMLIGQARQDVLDSLAVWQNDFITTRDIIDNEYFESILAIQGTLQNVSDQTLLTENRLETKYEEVVTITEETNRNTVTKIEELSASMYETDENGNVILDGDGNRRLAGSFITSIEEVTADKFSAEASSRRQLAAAIFEVNPDGSYVVDVNGNPVISGGFTDTIEQVAADERSAIASKIDNVSASIFQLDSEGDIILDDFGNPVLTGAFSSVVTAASADELSSAVAKIDNIGSSIFITNEAGQLLLDNNGRPILQEAFVESVDATLATANGELMAAIGDTLSVRRGNTDYSLTEIMAITLDNRGNYEAQWGVKTSINDLIYGAGFVARTDSNGQVKTGFHVAAGTFSIHNPANGEEVIPFIVNENGKVLINDLVVDTAVITNLVAETIVTEELFAGERIVSPIIQGGEISINDKFTVDSDGNMVGRGVVLLDEQGNVILNSDGISGTYIKDLSVDSAAIRGQAINSPHAVETEEKTLGQTSIDVHDFPTGKYIGGGIQFSITFSILNVSSSKDDESLVVRISIYEGTTEVKGYDFVFTVTNQGLYETGTACGMFSEEILNAYRNKDLRVHADIRTTGLGRTEQIKYSMTGFILYAKK